jgi:hypothetical protein
MRSWIFGAILAGGFVLTPTLPADAQVTFSYGRPAGNPGVTYGQPYYPNGNAYYNGTVYNNGQPGVYGNRYYSQPGTYRSQGFYPYNQGSPYPPNTSYYHSGYRGYTTAPNVYAPVPYRGSTGSGYYGNRGMYLNIPRLGSIPIR